MGNTHSVRMKMQIQQMIIISKQQIAAKADVQPVNGVVKTKTHKT
jgi:hypothetical protein